LSTFLFFDEYVVQILKINLDNKLKCERDKRINRRNCKLNRDRICDERIREINKKRNRRRKKTNQDIAIHFFEYWIHDRFVKKCKNKKNVTKDAKTIIIKEIEQNNNKRRRNKRDKKRRNNERHRIHNEMKRIRFRFDFFRITTRRTRIHECFALNHLFKTFKFTFDHFIFRKSRRLCTSRKTWNNHANDEINKMKIKKNKNWKNEKVKEKMKRLRIFFYKNELLQKD
jgi:hypothetical protein